MPVGFFFPFESLLIKDVASILALTDSIVNNNFMLSNLMGIFWSLFDQLPALALCTNLLRILFALVLPWFCGSFSARTHWLVLHSVLQKYFSASIYCCCPETLSWPSFSPIAYFTWTSNNLKMFFKESLYAKYSETYLFATNFVFFTWFQLLFNANSLQLEALYLFTVNSTYLKLISICSSHPDCSPLLFSVS